MCTSMCRRSVACSREQIPARLRQRRWMPFAVRACWLVCAVAGWLGLGLLAAAPATENAASELDRTEAAASRPSGSLELAEQGAAAAYARRDYTVAWAQYRDAMALATRPVDQRRLGSRLVHCLRRSGQYGAAVEAWLRLLDEHPRHPVWECAPLAWHQEQPDRLLLLRGEKWLADRGRPAARLLAASWLLTGPSRAAAEAALRDLTRSGTAEVRLLAQAQLWRLRVAQADVAEVRLWQEQVDAWPDTCRSGPLIVIAHAWTRHDQTIPATLAWLQVAWDEDTPDDIAARALEQAALALNRAGQEAESRRLSAEREQKYPDVTEARLLPTNPSRPRAADPNRSRLEVE